MPIRQIPICSAIGKVAEDRLSARLSLRRPRPVADRAARRVEAAPIDLIFIEHAPAGEPPAPPSERVSVGAMRRRRGAPRPCRRPNGAAESLHRPEASIQRSSRRRQCSVAAVAAVASALRCVSGRTQRVDGWQSRGRCQPCEPSRRQGLQLPLAASVPPSRPCCRCRVVDRGWCVSGHCARLGRCHIIVGARAIAP